MTLVAKSRDKMITKFYHWCALFPTTMSSENPILDYECLMNTFVGWSLVNINWSIMLIVTISPWYRERYRMCWMYPHQVLWKIKSGWQEKKPETINVTTVKVMGHNANRTNTSCHVFYAIRQTKAVARQFPEGPGIGLKQSPILLRKLEGLNHMVSIYHIRFLKWEIIRI